MSNNWFNFTYPLFNTKYGVDWTDYMSITDDNVDYVMNKTYQLYWLNDPNYFTTRIAEIILSSLGIEYTVADTLATKKLKIRQFLTQTAYKGLGSLYLDIAETVTGTRGTIVAGIYGGWSAWPFESGISNKGRWGKAGATSSDNIKWSAFQTLFKIYVDVKTLDNIELDLIQEMYRQGMLLPAFYQIYLVDSSFNILRTI